MEPSPRISLEPGRLYRLGWGLYLLMALAGGVWIGLRMGVIPLSLFFDPRGWWLDLLLGIGSGLVLLGLWWAAERTSPLARSLEDQLAALLGPVTVSEALALAFLSGFAEELFFRGAVQGSWPGMGGWLAASALFALLHSGPGPAFRLWTLFAAVAGVLFGGLMAWRGNLLAPMVGHFLVNAINLRRLAGRAAEDSARLARGEAQAEKES